MIIKLITKNEKINYTCLTCLNENAIIYEKEIIDKYAKKESEKLFNIEKCRHFNKNDNSCNFKKIMKKFESKCNYV